jgi:hypothetical protein
MNGSMTIFKAIVGATLSNPAPPPLGSPRSKPLFREGDKVKTKNRNNIYSDLVFEVTEVKYGGFHGSNHWGIYLAPTGNTGSGLTGMWWPEPDFIMFEPYHNGVELFMELVK